MKINSKDSFKSLKKLKIDNKTYNIFSLKEAEKNGLEGISKLPKSIKVLLENLLRFEDEKSVKQARVAEYSDSERLVLSKLFSLRVFRRDRFAHGPEA